MYWTPVDQSQTETHNLSNRSREKNQKMNKDSKILSPPFFYLKADSFSLNKRSPNISQYLLVMLVDFQISHQAAALLDYISN